MRSVWLILALLVGLLAPAWVAAAEESDEDESAPVFTAGEIIVTGKRTPAERVASLDEISAQQIEDMGARNVAEALQFAPGARVDTAPTSLSANGKQESLGSLRGFDPRNVIVLIDGVPMYEPYFRVLDLRQIPVGDIAKIKIVKGPTSVLYGPNALGGVINIITKRGAGEPRGHLDVSYGDVNTFDANGSLLGGANGWEYFLSSGATASDGFPVSRDFDPTRNEDGDLRFNSDFRDFVAAGKVGWQQGLNGLTASASHYQYEGGVPFSMEAIEPGTLWRKDWRKTTASLHGEWAPADFLYLRGRAFYSRFFNTITSYTDTTMSAVATEGDAVSTYDNNVMGYILLPEFLLGPAGTLTLSNLYKYDTVHIQDEDRADWYDFGAETISGGGEYAVELWRLAFTAGAAYHFYRRTETPNDELGEDDGAVDYMAGLAFTPVEMLSLHAGAAHKSAFPDLKTLYGSEGNPDLDPEAANNIDAGFRLAPLRQLALEATYFHSDITDLIGKREFGNEYTYENIDEATITGVESALDVNLLDDLLGLSVNHTWMQTEDKRENRLLDRLDFRPEHSVNVGGYAAAPWGTRLAVQHHYVSERQYEGSGAEPAVLTMPAYGFTNARLAQTFAWDAGRTKLEVFCEGKNLFDVYYEPAPEKPAPGRELFAGVGMDF
ncbi:MAG TPA: TonB-dependent receptor [bacterium]|nr:TonB-dependent receptor [bacterium]